MEDERLITIVNHLKLKSFKIYEIYEIQYLIDDINDVTINSELLLIYALYNMSNDVKLFHALLQCGCNMFALNNDGVSAYYLTHIDLSNDIPQQTRDVFKLYYPGLWAAVDQGSIELVRKAINLWCTINIKKDEKTLIQLAEEKNNQQVLSLLSSISSSISLAHAVLSNNVERLRTITNKVVICNSLQKGGINVDIQNLGALGATPLYFAMQNNNESMVKCLLDLGGNPCRVLTLEDEVEIPIIFLSLRSIVNFNIYRLMVVKASTMCDLASLRYKSCSLLHCAVENEVEFEKIDCLLENSDAKLICARTSRNLTAKDLSRDDFIRQKIDKRVLMNVNDESFTMDLVEYGYRDFIDILSLANNPQNLPNMDNLNKFTLHVKQFTKNICESNIVGIQKYLVYSYKSSQNERLVRRYLVNSFSIGDGQPMLHKSVLKGSPQVVELLCSVIVGTLGRKIDSVKDQFGRTALCYSYLLSTNHVSDVLIQFGASEYSIDYENKSPLAFKDKLSHPKREEFISYHTIQDYENPEPSLWSNVNPRSYIMSYNVNKSHPGNCQECVLAGDKGERHDSNSKEEDDDDDDDDDDEPASVCIIS